MTASKSLIKLIALGCMVNLSHGSQFLNNLSSFAAGGVGGVCSVLVGHPFDLVKVRQQTQQKEVPSTKDNKNEVVKVAKKGTFGTLADIVRAEGFGGIYRGVGAPLVAVAPIWATSFWGYDTGDKLVRLFMKLSPDARLNIAQLCIAGGFSALPTAIVMVPCERIKCLLQTQTEGTGKKYNGFSDCAAKLYAEAGVKGLYKGTALTLMRDIPGNMVYFGVYEVAKRYVGTGAAGALIAGALAGTLFWPVILPMDCLKSRYQTAPEGTYRNIGEVYSKLVEAEGIGGMFAGMGPAMIRSAPANAVSFMGAQVTKNFLVNIITP